MPVIIVRTGDRELIDSVDIEAENVVTGLARNIIGEGEGIARVHVDNCLEHGSRIVDPTVAVRENGTSGIGRYTDTAEGRVAGSGVEAAYIGGRIDQKLIIGIVIRPADGYIVDADDVLTDAFGGILHVGPVEGVKPVLRSLKSIAFPVIIVAARPACRLDDLIIQHIAE